SRYDGPLSVCWLTTGNNLSIVGDTHRRLSHVRLESKWEHPEERSGFRYPDLRAAVLEKRSELLSAALTILRAFVVAGRPDMKLLPWGSFEGWSDLVRSAVVFAGMKDPGGARMAMRAASCPETEAIAALYAGIIHLDKGGGVSVADLIKTA